MIRTLDCQSENREMRFALSSLPCRAAIVVLLGLAAAGGAGAQTATAVVVTGVVQDQTGAVVPNAKISALNVKTHAEESKHGND